MALQGSWRRQIDRQIAKTAITTNFVLKFCLRGKEPELSQPAKCATVEHSDPGTQSVSEITNSHYITRPVGIY